MKNLSRCAGPGWLSWLLVLMLMLAAGCGQPPEKALDDAEKALREAVVVSECAEVEFQEAEAALAEARRLVEEGDYDAAEVMAKKARALAERAQQVGQERWEDCQKAKNPPAATASNEPDPIDLLLKDGKLATVYFDFNESTLSAQAQDTLQKNAEWMRRNPTAKVTVAGHCDERGTTEFNIALGERRSQTVRKYMIQLGIDDSRLGSVSYGAEVPAVAGNAEESHSRNRRAEFIVQQ